MPFNKDDTAVAVGVGLLLLVAGGGVAKAALSEGKAKARGKGKKTTETDDEAAADAQHLMARANQPEATAWVPYFENNDLHPKSGSPIAVTHDLASAIGRWIGLESSGDPTIVSTVGERGLLQAGKQSVSEGLLMPDQWDALIDPTTGKMAQASINMYYLDSLYGAAAKHIKNPVPGDWASDVWYAYMWHYRPKDFTDNKFSGHAIDMARMLAKKWKGQAQPMHRLRAANIVAFGTPTP
jgi:hypothetical protein